MNIQDHHLYSKLSNREYQVLVALVQGLQREQIAEQLSISVHTYDGYRKSIRQKLNIRSTMDWSRLMVNLETAINTSK